jgi:hypothetical protein
MYSMKYALFIEKGESLLFAMPWIDVEDIALGELSLA